MAKQWRSPPADGAQLPILSRVLQHLSLLTLARSRELDNFYGHHYHRIHNVTKGFDDARPVRPGPMSLPKHLKQAGRHSPQHASLSFPKDQLLEPGCRKWPIELRGPSRTRTSFAGWTPSTSTTLRRR